MAQCRPRGNLPVHAFAARRLLRGDVQRRCALSPRRVHCGRGELSQLCLPFLHLRISPAISPSLSPAHALPSTRAGRPSYDRTPTPTHGPWQALFGPHKSEPLDVSRAGAQVRQLHGSVEQWQCARPCTPVTWAAPPHVRFDVDDDTMTAAGGGGGSSNRPMCAHCGGPARPAVLLFGNDVAAIYGTPTLAACWAGEVAPPRMHVAVIRGAAARKRACAGGLLQPSRSAVRCCGWRGDCM